MRNKTFFMICLVLMAALLTACASIASAQSSTPINQAEVKQEESKNDVPRTLSATGSGRAFLTPDVAYITIGVHTEDKVAAEAVAGNNSQSQKVVDALEKLGINEKDIQTTNFSIYPQQQYDPQGKPTGEITYMVDNSIYVTVRDLNQIGDLLDATVAAGANTISGIQFDVTDKSQALSEAREAAVANARAKAEELADAAGVILGPVQTINEYGGGYPVPMMIEGKGGGGDVMMAEASVPISPGQMTITLEVNIVYEIR